MTIEQFKAEMIRLAQEYDSETKWDIVEWDSSHTVLNILYNYYKRSGMQSAFNRYMVYFDQDN